MGKKRRKLVLSVSRNSKKCIEMTLLDKTFNNFQKNVGQTEREAATELGFLSYIVLAKMSDLDPKVTKQGKQYHRMIWQSLCCPTL